jgi:peroxiredoxin Q/BCP
MQTNGSQRVRLKDYAGKPLVLFFYPQDDTETCTKEALAFSEKQSLFSRRKIGLLGVSPDPVESHDKFVKKYGLKVSLGADPDLAVTKAYLCWGEKKLYGREYMGVIRSTFVIDPKGVIRAVWRNVRVKGHVEAVLEAVAALN